MRKELQKINGKRQRFTGEFERYGEKISFGYKKITLLLVNIKDERGNLLTDHLWFTVGKQLKNLDLKEGDKVSFDARVKSYIKGYRGRREDADLPPVTKDYMLSNPNNFCKHISEGSQGTLF